MRLFTPIRSRPPQIRGVLATTVRSEDAQVLCAEVMKLLKKEAIEIVSPAQSESGFYSCYFFVPKKRRRPATYSRSQTPELRPGEKVVQDDHFETILSQICLGDWFMLLDLKDANFHIQVAPHHRRFLRFAFEGVAYQYKVLPFGLSHFYTMHGCGSLPSETDGNPHTQLPQRLAHSGPVAGAFGITDPPP